MRGHIRRSLELKSRRGFLRLSIGAGAVGLMPAAKTIPARAADPGGKWECQNQECDPYIYDPELGDPDQGVAPGTPFSEIPDDWICPVCGEPKSRFSPFEE